MIKCWTNIFITLFLFNNIFSNAFISKPNACSNFMMDYSNLFSINNKDIHQINSVNNLNNAEQITPIVDQHVNTIGYQMVKFVSSALPHVDSIGHKMLHLDNELINYLLDSSLSPELKKELILFIIRVSQEGDNFGSYVLHIYYDFVDKSL